MNNYKTTSLKELSELKLQLEETMQKVEENYLSKAEIVREQRTTKLENTVNSLKEIYKVAKQYGLTERGGFYRLKTDIDPVIYPDGKLHISLNDDLKHGFGIGTKKASGSYYGYFGEWSILIHDKFPIEKLEGLSDYSKEVLNLIENWDTHYPETEKMFIEDCHKSLVSDIDKMKKML